MRASKLSIENSLSVHSCRVYTYILYLAKDGAMEAHARHIQRQVPHQPRALRFHITFGDFPYPCSDFWRMSVPVQRPCVVQTYKRTVERWERKGTSPRTAPRRRMYATSKGRCSTSFATHLRLHPQRVIITLTNYNTCTDSTTVYTTCVDYTTLYGVENLGSGLLGVGIMVQDIGFRGQGEGCKAQGVACSV